MTTPGDAPALRNLPGTRFDTTNHLDSDCPSNPSRAPEPFRNGAYGPYCFLSLGTVKAWRKDAPLHEAFIGLCGAGQPGEKGLSEGNVVAYGQYCFLG